MEKTIHIQYYSSSYGELILGSFEDRLCLCDWKYKTRRESADRKIQQALQAAYSIASSEIIETALRQLNEYFNRERTVFDLPLLFIGTDFQKEVWNKLLEIPYGATESYEGLATRLNNPKAVRAVAAANGANPISIFVPCHRIIGKNNKLTGYAGGLETKKKLLLLEASGGINSTGLFAVK